MDSDTSRTTGSLLLLLSLLLHILLLLFFFIFQSPSHEAPHIEYFDPENQLFDPQQQAQQSQQQQQQADPYDPDHEIMVELLSQGVEPNNTLTDDPGELTPPAQIQDTQTKTPDDTVTDDQQTPDDDGDSEDQASEESPTEDKAPLRDEPSPEEPSKGASYEPFTIPDITPTPQALRQTQEPTRPKQAAKKIVRKMVQRPPMQPADVKLLSKVAQGFMESMFAELGNAPSNDPTQLAHQRYMTKLWNNLKQTMNAENNVLALSASIDTQAVLVMTINKQGKLLNALLRHPRKTTDISKMESMLITNAQKVGLFPPLPASFKRDEVTFVMPIHLRAQSGVHSGYRLQVEQ